MGRLPVVMGRPAERGVLCNADVTKILAVALIFNTLTQKWGCES